VDWLNIGTPATSEFETGPGMYHPSLAARLYGPMDVMEKRETTMIDSVATIMESKQSAVLVVGLAHLHSMASRLALLFDVVPFGAPFLFPGTGERIDQ
jgi:hypothetical protein